MSYVSILNQATAPAGLPISANFIIPSFSASSQMLVVSGTVWGSIPATIGIQILVNGSVVGQTALCSNQPGLHITPATVFIPVTLAPNQNHTLTLQYIPGSPTVADANDYFDAVLLA